MLEEKVPGQLYAAKCQLFLGHSSVQGFIIVSTSVERDSLL